MEKQETKSAWAAGTIECHTHTQESNLMNFHLIFTTEGNCLLSSLRVRAASAAGGDG